MAEPYFPWKDEYSVGIRLIDNDHKELFETVNELHAIIEDDLDWAAIREITNRLVRYVQEHFEREEHLMAEYWYPGLAQHRQLHHNFVRLVFAIRKIEAEAPQRLDPKKLLALLEGWLQRHIMKADREYLPYLRGDYGRRKSDLTLSIAESGKPSSAMDEDSEDQDELTTIPVQVPFSAVNTIRRCARLLRMKEEGADALESLTDPITNMTLDDALVLAKLVVRD